MDSLALHWSCGCESRPEGASEVPRRVIAECLSSHLLRIESGHPIFEKIIDFASSAD
jgi:hypothetical protein